MATNTWSILRRFADRTLHIYTDHKHERFDVCSAHLDAAAAQVEKELAAHFLQSALETLSAAIAILRATSPKVGSHEAGAP